MKKKIQKECTALLLVAIKGIYNEVLNNPSKYPNVWAFIKAVVSGKK